MFSWEVGKWKDKKLFCLVENKVCINLSSCPYLRRKKGKWHIILLKKLCIDWHFIKVKKKKKIA